MSQISTCLFFLLKLLHVSLGNSYRDILHPNKKPFYLKGLEEESAVMDAYLMHSVRICLLEVGYLVQNLVFPSC